MADEGSSSWRARLGRIAAELKAEVERAGKSIGIGNDDRPYEITPYRGYGNRSRLLVHGRVIESRNIAAASDADSLWRNLVNTYKRIDSDPLPRARVQVRLGDHEREVVADEEGFFREWIELASPLEGDDHWREAEVRLQAPVRDGDRDVTGKAPIRVTTGTETFGVISDLDDI